MIDRTKLVIISEEFTDEQVEEVFNSTVINSEDELLELVECLEKHRPKVAKRFADALTPRSSTG